MGGHRIRLETIGEPYHYYLTDKQIGELGQGGRADRLDSLIHMMEKNWLDVDDFVTAFLVALSVHGVGAPPKVVLDSLKAAMKERKSLYAPRKGQIPAPKGGGVMSIEDMDKYLPEPAWLGSQVLGTSVGGAVVQPPKREDAE